MIPHVRPEIISILAVLNAVLCCYSYRKVEKMARSSIVLMFRIGILIIGPALCATGAMYAWFSYDDVPILIRQDSVRMLFVYLMGSLIVWQILVLRYGREL